MTTPETDELAWLADFIREPLFLVDGSGRISLANHAARTLLGVDAIGIDLSTFVADKDAFFAYLRRCSGTTRPLPGSIVVEAQGERRHHAVHGASFGRPSDSRRPRVVLHLRPLAAKDFSILSLKIHELHQEIRRRRQAQQDLEEALRHKETLLRELHHRVRNHSQMLLGMLAAAARATTSNEVRRLTTTLTSRLVAMGAAQRLMHEADEIETVGARDFLDSLCSAIRHSWSDDVELDWASDDVELDNDVTVSLALVLNELLTNAYKHGVAAGGRRVTVELRRSGGDMLLRVHDDGPGWTGLPSALDDHDARRATSGIALVQALCRQIGAVLDIADCNGTMCMVRLTYEQKESDNETA